MLKRVFAAVCISVAFSVAATAQSKKPAGTNSMMFDMTATVEDVVYTGTMEMAVKGGKVTGDMRITSPTEITGKVAGSAKAGLFALDFPFTMVEDNCNGTVKMNLKVSEKPGHASGTLEAVGCGDSPGSAVSGTVELKPPAKEAK